MATQWDEGAGWKQNYELHFRDQLSKSGDYEFEYTKLSGDNEFKYSELSQLQGTQSPSNTQTLMSIKNPPECEFDRGRSFTDTELPFILMDRGQSTPPSVGIPSPPISPPLQPEPPRKLDMKSLEQLLDDPFKYTPVTGRMSKAGKGVPVHKCNICLSGKPFPREMDMLQHRFRHDVPEYLCTFEKCESAFRNRPDLLAQHMYQHEKRGMEAFISSKTPKVSTPSHEKFDYPRDGCEMTFFKREDVYPHLNNHPPQEIYTCDFPNCAHTFVLKHRYNRHRAHHENDCDPPRNGILDPTNPTPWIKTEDSTLVETKRTRSGTISGFRARSHHRESSLSSLGSAGPSSPFTANAPNPRVAEDINPYYGDVVISDEDFPFNRDQTLSSFQSNDFMVEGFNWRGTPKIPAREALAQYASLDLYTVPNTASLYSPPASFWKRTYSKVAGFRRKAVRVLVKGIEHFARPDSASDENMMTEAFAKENGISIERGPEHTGVFMLGIRNYVQSIGRAFVPFKLLGDEQSSGHRWFHVLKKCPVPLIMGMGFIQETQLYVKKKHPLVDCPFNIGSMPTFKWIGSPQAFINFDANGISLSGCADTGSDLDFMSLRCALRNGFKIDRQQSSRTRIMLADGMIVETIGQVHISSVKLSQFDSFEMLFHILPDLASDVIFSEEFLEQMDAFNTCAEIMDSDDSYQQQLNTLINLGPLQAFLSKRWKPKDKEYDAEQREHNHGIEFERQRRNSVNRSIQKIRDNDQAEAARKAEDIKRRRFDTGHDRCRYCIGDLLRVRA